MTAECVSRDPVLDDFFDRIPEQYRPVVRSLALDMALDIEGIIVASYSPKNF